MVITEKNQIPFIIITIIIIIIIIGLEGRVFTNGPGDLGSIPGRVIPKTLKNGTCYLLA